MAERMRSDALRNYARILAVAEEEVATHGANASLEQISRIAGVGSATVRRHFPSRQALLEAVSRKRIEALVVRARDLTSDDTDSLEALLTWLREVVTYCITARGLATALSYDAGDPVDGNSCSASLVEAGERLLARAIRDGRVPSEITVADLVTLIAGIALVSEHAPDPAERADRMFRLVVLAVTSSGA